MPNRYAGLTPQEADSLLIDTIQNIITEEFASVRSMPAEEWNTRDLSRWTREVASCIYYATENRRHGAPLHSLIDEITLRE